MQAQGTTQAVPGVRAMGMTSLQPQIPSLGRGTGYSSGHPANAENSVFNCCFHKSSEPVGAGLSQQFEPINPVLCPLEASEVMCPPESSVCIKNLLKLCGLKDTQVSLSLGFTT